MKKSRKQVVLLSIVLLLTGCGSGRTVSEEKSRVSEEITVSRKDYVFQVQETTVSVEEEMATLLEKLGEPDSYFEAPSCAGQGIDKVYGYGSFDIYTSSRGDKDYISTICFKDDIVKTAEGIRVGDPRKKVEEIYGDDYEEQYGEMIYRGESTMLRFLIENDSVVSVRYQTLK